MKKELKKQGVEEEAIAEPTPTVKIESQEDILKDIRTLLTNISNSQNDSAEKPEENLNTKIEAEAIENKKAE